MSAEETSERNNLNGDTDCIRIKCEVLAPEIETMKDLDAIQSIGLTSEAKETENDVIDDESHVQHSDVKNNENDDGIGIQSKNETDVYQPRGGTEAQTGSLSPEQDGMAVECDEISTTVKSDFIDVSKSESKRHNVFKSIIDRLARKEGGRLENPSKILSSLDDSLCSGSAASSYPHHPKIATQNPAVIPRSSTSLGILFTNSSPSSSTSICSSSVCSSSVCSSSSSALNLSFLFRGFPGYDDSGMSHTSPQRLSADLPANVAHPIAKLQESSANCIRVPSEKKDNLAPGLYSDDDTFLYNAKMFTKKVELLDFMLQPDGTEPHPGMNRDQSVIGVDLLDNGDAAGASPETCRLGLIKRKYYKSLDYLQKVRVISGTLEREREKLRLKRLCLQRALRQLRFLYNVTRLRSAKGRTVDRQTISSLWNLAKFEEAKKEKPETEEEEEMKEEEDGEWHNIYKRLESEFEQGSSPRSSPEHFHNRQKCGKNENENIGCDDDVTTTSFPVNYSLRRENDATTRGSQRIISRAHAPTSRNFPMALRRANPVEAESLSDRFSRYDHMPLIADGAAGAWRGHINSTLCSSADQLEGQTTDDFTMTNNIPAHSSGYSRSNPPDTRKRLEEVGGGGGGGGYAPVNHQRAHVASNRLEVNVGKTPAAAHEAKRDISNFTYLYCSQNGI